MLIATVTERMRSPVVKYSSALINLRSYSEFRKCYKRLILIFRSVNHQWRISDNGTCSTYNYCSLFLHCSFLLLRTAYTTCIYLPSDQAMKRLRVTLTLNVNFSWLFCLADRQPGLNLNHPIPFLINTY